MDTTLKQPETPARFLRRTRRTIGSHPAMSVVAALLVGALVIWLVFFFFAFHLLFIDDKVDEADPFASASPSATTIGATASAAGGTTQAAANAQVTHRGSFVDRSHATSGVATIITDGAKTFVRFEDLRTDNGPDLFVYLSAGVTATSPAGTLDDDFVDLGKLKGNVGSQNYEISPGTDLAKYRTVVIWCLRFATAFGASDLAPTAPGG